MYSQFHLFRLSTRNLLRPSRLTYPSFYWCFRSLLLCCKMYNPITSSRHSPIPLVTIPGTMIFVPFHTPNRNVLGGSTLSKRLHISWFFTFVLHFCSWSMFLFFIPPRSRPHQYLISYGSLLLLHLLLETDGLLCHNIPRLQEQAVYYFFTIVRRPPSEFILSIPQSPINLEIDCQLYVSYLGLHVVRVEIS